MSKDGTPKVVPAKKPGRFLVRYSEADLPTARGVFHAIVFRDRRDGAEHVALVGGQVEGGEAVPVRIHSECLTGQGFGRLKCDCPPEPERAMEVVSPSPPGG